MLHKHITHFEDNYQGLLLRAFSCASQTYYTLHLSELHKKLSWACSVMQTGTSFICVANWDVLPFCTAVWSHRPFCKHTGQCFWCNYTLVSIDLCSHPGNYTHASVCAHIQVITLMLSAHIQVITLMPA